MPARQSPMRPAVMPRKTLSSPSAQEPRPGEAINIAAARRQEEQEARIVALASRVGQESGSRPGSFLLVTELNKSIPRDRASLSPRARDRSCIKGYIARDSRNGGVHTCMSMSRGRTVVLPEGMTYICICRRLTMVSRPTGVVALRHRHGSCGGDHLHSTLSAQPSKGCLPILGHRRSEVRPCNDC
jgi:hypothetical protein